MPNPKQSEVSKKRWSAVPKEERSRVMRDLALKRLAKMTPEQKQAHIDKMVKARLG